MSRTAGRRATACDPTRLALVDQRLPTQTFPPASRWDTRTLHVRGDNGTIHWLITATLEELTLERP